MRSTADETVWFSELTSPEVIALDRERRRRSLGRVRDGPGAPSPGRGCRPLHQSNTYAIVAAS